MAGLEQNVEYVILDISPTPATLGFGNYATIRLCEPGGPDFDLRVRITYRAQSGLAFRATTLPPDRRQAQLVDITFDGDHPVAHHSRG